MQDPLDSIRIFAAALGWHGLRPYCFTIEVSLSHEWPLGEICTSFTTPDVKFNLQINQAVPERFGKYRASVVAHRYDIRHVDFFDCAFDTIDSAKSEAARLFAHLARSNFKNPRWRRGYLEHHPDR